MKYRHTAGVFKIKKGLFISGSGTDVGKTFIAIRIIKALNGAVEVVARKPIESGCQKTATGLWAKDARLLNEACLLSEDIEKVCRFVFEACVSGEKASSQQGLSITLADLVDAAKPVDENHFVIVEGAGGLYSPIATNVLNSDLAKALGLPVVLVVRDELGAINQALLSLQAARAHKLNVVMLVLNQKTANDLDNASALSAYTDVKVVVFNNDLEKQFAEAVLALDIVNN